MSSPKLASGFRTSPVLPLRRTVPPWRRATRLALPVVIVVFAFVFPYLVDRPRFWLPNIGVESLWLATIALSMVFLNRYLGLLSLGQVSVAGLCAYGVAFTVVRLGQPLEIALPIGIAVGTAWSFVIALVAARTRAIYFLMITLAIGQVFYSWAAQEIAVTGARRGLNPVDRPTWFGYDLNEPQWFYYFAVVVALIAYVLVRWVGSTTFGLTLEGIRDAPDRMRALGYSVFKYRVIATTFAGFIASLGGVILVLHHDQADPESFNLQTDLNVLVVAVLGGVLTPGAVFLGAVAFTLLSNFSQNFTDRYMTLTGAVFIVVLLFAPAGLYGIPAQVTRFLRRRSEVRPTGAVDDPEPRSSAVPAEDRAIRDGSRP